MAVYLLESGDFGEGFSGDNLISVPNAWPRQAHSTHDVIRSLFQRIPRTVVVVLRIDPNREFSGISGGIHHITGSLAHRFHTSPQFQFHLKKQTGSGTL